MKILLATDGSDIAKIAGDFLARFPFPPGTEVRLVTVIRDTFLKYEDWVDWEHREGLSEQHRTDREEAEQLIREEREDLISKDAERLGSTGWTCTTEVRVGQPADEILRASAASATNPSSWALSARRASVGFTWAGSRTPSSSTHPALCW